MPVQGQGGVAILNDPDTRHMRQGLQEITDYKKKSSHVTDTNVKL
jgi:hypothetical protein